MSKRVASSRAERIISRGLVLAMAIVLMACQKSQVVKDLPMTASGEERIEEDSSPAARPSPATENGKEATQHQVDMLRCDGVADDRDRTDCVAMAAASDEEFSSLDRHELCRQTPFPLRCHYLLALEDGEAQPCQEGREKLLWRYYDECQLLHAMEKDDIRRCAQVLGADVPLDEDLDLVTVCKRIARAETLLDMPITFDEFPADGEGFHKLLAYYYVAIAYEYHLYLLERDRIYDVHQLTWHDEEYKLWHWHCDDRGPAPPSHGWYRLMKIDFPMATFFAGLFTPTFGRHPSFHIRMNRFDPQSWEGLEQMLTVIRLYALSSAPHVPQSTLTFDEDGTYRFRERVSDLGDHEHQIFTLHSGTWEIISAVPGEPWAIIALDGEQYAFGECDGAFILHPAEGVSDLLSCRWTQYSDAEYTGECG